MLGKIADLWVYVHTDGRPSRVHGEFQSRLLHQSLDVGDLL